MKKILIKNFPNLNNYGTGMMGLVTIQMLMEKYGKDNIEIYSQFNEYANIDEINNEFSEPVQLNTYIDKVDEKIANINNAVLKKVSVILSLIFYKPKKEFDLIIVLGGDDFSECSSKYIASIELYKLWRCSMYSKVIMLAQTIGPFSNAVNRFTFRHLLSKMSLYARDPWTAEYIDKAFNLKVKQMGDLAFNSLPLQGNVLIEHSILKQYGLSKDGYFTIVISGLVKEGYYCKDEDVYLLRHRDFILRSFENADVKGKKVVLLAHTFPPYGDEASLVEKLYNMFTTEQRELVVLIKEKIYPTKARFILGNGIFTVTGRMHPAVSTFQMGKPAIALSYSQKYYGVLGKSLNRIDLIINANEPDKWISGEIVSLVEEKVGYLLDNYTQIVAEIKSSVEQLKEINNNILQNI